MKRWLDDMNLRLRFSPSIIENNMGKQMPVLIMVLLSMLIGLSSCDAQSTKYRATGGGTLDSTNAVACLATVHGIELEDGQRKSEIQNFIYVMIVCPGAKLSLNPNNESGIEGDPTVEIHYQWATVTGDLKVNFRWDVQSDVVTIGKQEFHRKAGNVFLILRKENGELEGQQCGTLGPKASYGEIEQRVRTHAPENEIIRTVSFPSGY